MMNYVSLHKSKLIFRLFVFNKNLPSLPSLSTKLSNFESKKLKYLLVRSSFGKTQVGLEATF